MIEQAERLQCLWCGTVKNEDMMIFEDGYPYCNDVCLYEHTRTAVDTGPTG